MKKIIFSLFLSLLCIFHAEKSYAQILDSLTEGTYPVRASLSCYINAMGGVEFGGPMLKAAEIHAADDGTKTMTMYLQKSVVTIYSVTCDTFVDAAPAGAVTEGEIAAGTIGYYDPSGAFTTDGVSYTFSADTVLNSKQEEVVYVNSITFPLKEEKESYELALYINSNVMGTQFSHDGHRAVLTVDWNSVQTAGSETMENMQPETEAENTAETAVTAVSETILETAEETAAETEKAAEETAADVEKLSGLNIYRAESDQDPQEIQEEEPEAADHNYTAYFNRTVLVAAAAVGIVLVLLGAILMFIGMREDKKHEK